jgi:hypothetical protein
MSAIDHILQGDRIGRMRAMQSQSVDFILTDPPYVARYRSRDGRKVANDDNADWLRPAFAEMYRVLKYRSFCVSFYGWHKAHLFIAAWRAAGFRPVGHIMFRERYASSVRFLRYQHEFANSKRAVRHETARLRRERRQALPLAQVARRREQLRAYAAAASPPLFELPAVAAHRRRAPMLFDPSAVPRAGRASASRDVPAPITLTVIGVPACTVRES